MSERGIYKGKMESASLNGEATFVIEEEGLSCSTLFDDEVIAYEQTDAFRFENHSTYLSAAGRSYRFFYMGQQNEWMFDALYAAYNKRVLSALLVTQVPILTAEGLCAYEGRKERAVVSVFPDCLCVLPQGRLGRRYPFVFMNGLKRDGYALSISLSTNESCTFSMLGQNLEPLERVITQRVREMREENRKFLQEVCPALSYSDTAAASRLLHEGIAAPLASLSDALRGTLVRKAKNSKMGAYYDKLLSLGDGGKLAVGLKALDEETVEALKAALLERLNANAEQEVTLTPEQEDALKWVVWAALPTPDGRHAIVEFAIPNEDAATYVFRLEGGFDSLLPVINRALEAGKLSREIFSATDARLSGDMRMLIARTPAAERLRGCFVGKAVHRSPETWAKSIASLTKPKAQPQRQPQGASCPQCGTRLEGGAKFCGSCGARVSAPAPGRCPSCGVQNAPGMRFCGQCGTRLGNGDLG